MVSTSIFSIVVDSFMVSTNLGVVGHSSIGDMVFFAMCKPVFLPIYWSVFVEFVCMLYVEQVYGSPIFFGKYITFVCRYVYI